MTENKWLTDNKVDILSMNYISCNYELVIKGKKYKKSKIKT